MYAYVGLEGARMRFALTARHPGGVGAIIFGDEDGALREVADLRQRKFSDIRITTAQGVVAAVSEADLQEIVQAPLTRPRDDL
jgi:hypothetical protein